MAKAAKQLLQVQKKSARRDTIFVSVSSLKERDKLITLQEIDKKLISKFRHHIGEENRITPRELFEYIFDVNIEEVDTYCREYWWNVIKFELRELRKQQILFVINKGHYLFVLQTRQELADLNHRYDGSIKEIKRMKTIAKKWVEQRKWTKI